MEIDKNLFTALQAIADGYPVSVYFDSIILVENPAFREDNGHDPYISINIVEYTSA